MLKMKESARVGESSVIGANYETHQPIQWKARWKVEKYHGEDFTAPYEVIEKEGNLLMHGGASCIWETLIGNGTTSSGQSLTYFNNANSHIGVGNGTIAAAATQNDLQASGGTANQIRKAMDSTYPQHSDGTNAGAGTITFRSTYGTADANFHWYEWGVFNGSSGGRMLNRKQEDLGSKTSASTWTFSVSLSLA
jgi:hypothetical protein